MIGISSYSNIVNIVNSVNMYVCTLNHQILSLFSLVFFSCDLSSYVFSRVSTLLSLFISSSIFVHTLLSICRPEYLANMDIQRNALLCSMQIHILCI